MYKFNSKLQGVLTEDCELAHLEGIFLTVAGNRAKCHKTIWCPEAFPFFPGAPEDVPL